MRKFVVNVNGKQYEVEVQEMASGAAPVAVAPVAAPAPVAAAPAPVAAPAPAAPAAAAPVNGTPITSPMPGTLVDIKVAVGDAVKSGQVVAILEAMKMENEIMCDKDGVVAAISASKGDGLSSGDVIMVIG